MSEQEHNTRQHQATPAGQSASSLGSTVALVRCETYDSTEVEEAIGRGLALLGGVERFVRPGEALLLKPNLLVGTAPEKHVTTHPAVFGAVAQHLQAAGATLSYGDSPGFGRTASAARRSGLTEVAAELGIALADFDAPETVSFPEGGLIKRFTVAAAALAAAGIVSLPKLKTHGLMRLTGAVKNQFGCIPGLRKGEFHTRLPDLERFAQMLVDLNRLLRPRLYVMDAVVAMEGNGPRSGDPCPLGLLLLSADPIALDTTAARLVNLNPNLVPTIRWGQRWGLGHAEAAVLVGDPPEAFAVPDFRVNRSPISTTGRQGFFGRLVRDWLVPRPALRPDHCTRCGICVEVCPVQPKAVEFRHPAGRDHPPEHDYRLCIRCYCCQEMCPEGAIQIEVPPLGRLLHRRDDTGPA